MLFLKQAANIHAICQGRAEDGGGSAEGGDSQRRDSITSFVGAYVHNYTHTHKYAQTHNSTIRGIKDLRPGKPNVITRGGDFTLDSERMITIKSQR